MVPGVLVYSMKADSLTVVESTNDNIPEGTTLTVDRHHVNQYTGRETIDVSPDPLPDHRVGSFQMFRTGDNWWTEIVVGRTSDEVRVE